jgi:hypothetical protein
MVSRGEVATCALAVVLMDVFLVVVAGVWQPQGQLGRGEMLFMLGGWLLVTEVFAWRALDPGVPEKKKKRRAEARRFFDSGLLFLRTLFGRGNRSVAAFGRVLLFEPVNASGGVNQLLTAREEGMAGRADFHADIALVSRPRFERVAAGANHIKFVVSGVNTSLHCSTGILSRPSV